MNHIFENNKFERTKTKRNFLEGLKVEEIF